MRFSLPLLLGLAISLAITPLTARPSSRSKAAKRGGSARGARAPLSSRGAVARSADLAHLDRLMESGTRAIVVQKSQRRLTLVEGGETVKVYPINLGRDPVNPKSRAGDWRTPEGVYYVARKNPRSKYYLALHLSYPNKEDAERGLQAGLINQAQYEEIRQAIDAGALPPQNTRLGYYIEIHGRSNRVTQGPDGSVRLKGYTRGCIGVRDPDIEEVYAWAPVGTPVVILP